jgi:NAD(P)H-hydrate epimerase
MSPSASLRTLPRRPKDLHKGRAGVTLVVGGSCRGEERMAGAPALAACGAFRAGCGLVRVLTPEPLAVPVLQMMPSATATALAVDAEGLLLASAAAEVMDRHLIHAAAMVIGPGMSDDDATGALALRAVQQEQVAAVVDAGAISALARVPSLTKDFRGRVILTPHPGEFRRLAAGDKAGGMRADGPAAGLHRGAQGGRHGGERWSQELDLHAGAPVPSHGGNG